MIFYMCTEVRIPRELPQNGGLGWISADLILGYGGLCGVEEPDLMDASQILYQD